MTGYVEGVGNVGMTLQQLSGRPGIGAHHLLARLEVTSRPVLEGGTVLLSVTAEVAMSFAGGGPRPLGPGRFSGPVALSSVPRPSVDLTVDLSDGQVEQIDALRDGGDVGLVLDVAGVAHHPDGRADQFTGQYQLHVARGDWVEALGQAGALYAATVTLLLTPSGPGRARPEVAAALARARQALAVGRWTDAVAGCRQVLEVAGLSGQALNEAKRERSKDERYGRLADALFALYDVGSGATHQDTITSGFQWQRADAVAAVACCVALLHQHDAATAP